MKNKFSRSLRHFFQCDAGAFSVVTKNENEKRQVTAVGFEQELLESHFKGEIEKHQGSRKDMEANGVEPTLAFRKHPTGETVRLVVSYKKGKKNELRYYFNNEAFRPDADDYWFIFVRENEIWLGSFSERMLSFIEKKAFGETYRDARLSILEKENDDYQDSLNGNVPKKIITSGHSWSRNSKLARQAAENADYKCEIQPGFPTFTSKSSGRPFIEAHHLVPMMLQDVFSENLDVLENICILNPWSHRLLHHAKFDQIEEHIGQLAAKREAFLKQLAISTNDVLAMYT